MRIETQYRIIRIAAITFALAIIVGLIPLYANKAKAEQTKVVADVTFYTSGTDAVCAYGDKPREGICAGRKEWRDKTALVYTSEGDFIGIYEVKDTGGNAVKNGEVLDIWLPDRDECIQNGRLKDCTIYLVDAKG